ncbi:MAG: alpha/beta hydrolase [Verrucomicrobia bacterium]|nr:alpha/beta hydrolase [Verrucomicrobiota bacterium]
MKTIVALLKTRLLWTAIVSVLVVLGWLRYFEWINLFHPSGSDEGSPADQGLQFSDVEFMTNDGKRLHGWWVPHENALGTVLFCHGNAGNISTRTAIIRDLQAFGVNVFAFDYRGYGRSQGIPTEKGTYLDAEAAYEVVRSRYADAEDPPVAVYGRSLGGAVAVELALRKPVRALILESAFTSTVDIGKELYPLLPVDWFCRYRYDSAKKLPEIAVPKLIAHSPDDEVIPYRHGERLFEAAAPPKRFVRLSGTHDELAWVSSPQYRCELAAFLSEHLL